MPHSSDQAPGAARPATAVDAIAERYVARLTELSPEFAVYNGLPGRRGELDDYSPEGLAALSDLDRSTLRELDGVEAADDVDRVTVAAMREMSPMRISRHSLPSSSTVPAVSPS